MLNIFLKGALRNPDFRSQHDKIIRCELLNYKNRIKRSIIVSRQDLMLINNIENIYSIRLYDEVITNAIHQ